MLRYPANLTLLFTEVPFLERFGRAARAGFRAVEFLFAHTENIEGIEREMRRYGLEVILFGSHLTQSTGRAVDTTPTRFKTCE